MPRVIESDDSDCYDGTVFSYPDSGLHTEKYPTHTSTMKYCTSLALSVIIADFREVLDNLFGASSAGGSLTASWVFSS